MTSETQAPERIDIWVQSLCRELRQAGYLVPYERMMLSVQNVGHLVAAKDAEIAELEAENERLREIEDAVVDALERDYNLSDDDAGLYHDWQDALKAREAARAALSREGG